MESLITNLLLMTSVWISIGGIQQIIYAARWLNFVFFTSALRVLETPDQATNVFWET